MIIWLKRNAAVALLTVALGVMLLYGFGIIGGCATAYDSALVARGAMAKSLGENATAWLEYDRNAQREIVKLDQPLDVREGKIMAWRASVQAPIVEGFHVAEASLRVLDQALKAWKAGSERELPGALEAARRAFAALMDILKRHGVNLPLGGSGI